MRKKLLSKMISVFSIFICLALVLNSFAFAADVSPEFMETVESISIYPQFGIKMGEAIQLNASIEYKNSSFGSVEWFSSDSNVISCTKNGLINGISSNGYADITCKDKYGSVSDTIRVYCVEPIDTKKSSNMVNLITPIYEEPTSSSNIAAVNFDLSSILAIFSRMFKYIAMIGIVLNSSPNIEMALTEGKCEIHGKYDEYCYIRYKGSDAHDGFVEYTKLKEKVDSFLYLNRYDMDVWSDGIIRDNYKLTANYAGEVKWTVKDTNIVQYDADTNTVKGINPGTTTITAEADGMKRVCTVHSLYKWRQSWTGKARQETSIYKASGQKHVEYYPLREGEKFTVDGDMGVKNKDEWVYGCNESGVCGYVKISHISTKGTISQYNNLGWQWPVKTPAGKTPGRYITSPYGWRDTNPEKHKGIDITNGISSNADLENSIDGYNVVSAFDGRVIYINIDTKKSCGNCVAIRSDSKDPVTGKYYVAIYMHMKSNPNVEDNQLIPKGYNIGKVGNTGNSGASHLHFEVNNQNLSYGEKAYYDSNPSKEMIFGSTINPLFFFMDYLNLTKDNPNKITINTTCEAMKYRGPYWFGDDEKESKKP